MWLISFQPNPQVLNTISLIKWFGESLLLEQIEQNYKNIKSPFRGDIIHTFNAIKPISCFDHSVLKILKTHQVEKELFWVPGEMFPVSPSQPAAGLNYRLDKSK